MLRLRLALVALSFAALAALAGCDAADSDASDASLTGGLSAAATVSGDRAAPPPPPVLSATDLGVVAQLPIIRGRDGAISALVNGRSVWTFGDTPLNGPNADGRNWVDNSLSWTSDLDASDGIAFEGNYVDAVGAPAEIVPFLPWEQRYNEAHAGTPCQEEPCGAEIAFWPGDLIPDPARRRVLMTYYQLWRSPTFEGWRSIGGGFAVWDEGMAPGSVRRPVQNPGSRTPTLMWERDEVRYDNATLVDGETLYAYGCKLNFVVHACRVARVPLADVLDKTAWRYYTGTAWSADPTDAVRVFDGGAAGTSVFYVPHYGGYLAIYNPAFDNTVRYRVSRTPWGPWSEPQPLFTMRPGQGTFGNYSAHAHPEFAEAGGRVQYVTYAHTTGFLRQELPLVRVVFGELPE